jgi:hypothetical protein
MYDLYDPLKLSILTLLSVEKIHITNFVQFHDLIKDLLEFQKLFKDIKDVQYGSYILDMLAFSDDVDPRTKPSLRVIEVFDHIYK